MDTVGVIKVSIPPRSLDFNPIENAFNFVKSELRTQAFEQNVNHETFEQFSARVLKTLLTNILIKLLNRCQKECRWLSSQKGKG